MSMTVRAVRAASVALCLALFLAASSAADDRVPLETRVYRGLFLMPSGLESQPAPGSITIRVTSRSTRDAADSATVELAANGRTMRLPARFVRSTQTLVVSGASWLNARRSHRRLESFGKRWSYIAELQQINGTRQASAASATRGRSTRT